VRFWFNIGGVDGEVEHEYARIYALSCLFLFGKFNFDGGGSWYFVNVVNFGPGILAFNFSSDFFRLVIVDELVNIA